MTKWKLAPFRFVAEGDPKGRRAKRREARKHAKSLRVAADICEGSKDWRIAHIEARIAKLEEQKRQMILDYERGEALRKRAEALEIEEILASQTGGGGSRNPAVPRTPEEKRRAKAAEMMRMMKESRE